MFRKIQSYVTPILLSYVDKYIKDFKTEDTQVNRRILVLDIDEE